MLAFPSPRSPAAASPSGRALITLAVTAAALAAALQSIGMAERALWLDEISTVQSIRGSWGDLVAHRVGAGHFPLFFALMKALGLADAGEAALRLPALAMMAAAVGLMAVTAARLGGLAAGIAAGATAALMPLTIAYGQEARPIAMLVLGMAIAVEGHVGLAEGRRRAGLVFAAGIAIAGVSILAGTILAVALTALVLRGRERPAGSRRRITATMVAAGVAAAASLAVLPGAADRAMDRLPVTPWWSLVDAVGGLSQAWLFAVARDPQQLLPASVDWLLAPAVIALAGVGYAALSPVHRALARQWGGAAAILTGLLALGCLYSPALKARYLAGTVPMLVPLIGCGLATLWARSRRGRLAVAAAALLAAAQAGDAVLADSKPEWRPFIALLGDPPPKRFTVLTTDIALRREMDHYLPKGSRMKVVVLPKDDGDLYPLIADLPWDAPVWLVDWDGPVTQWNIRRFAPVCATRYRTRRPVVAARLDLDHLFQPPMAPLPVCR